MPDDFSFHRSLHAFTSSREPSTDRRVIYRSPCGSVVIDVHGPTYDLEQQLVGELVRRGAADGAWNGSALLDGTHERDLVIIDALRALIVENVALDDATFDALDAWTTRDPRPLGDLPRHRADIARLRIIASEETGRPIAPGPAAPAPTRVISWQSPAPTHGMRSAPPSAPDHPR